MQLKEMFYCNHCKEVIENPITISEIETGEENFLCHWCLSQDLSSCGQCLMCKAWHLWNEPNESFICDKCADTLKQRFELLLTSNFSNFERERLNEIFEGDYF